MRINSRRNVVVHGRAQRRTDLSKVASFECFAVGDEDPKTSMLRINVVGQDFKPEQRMIGIEIDATETEVIMRVIARSERLRSRMVALLGELPATGY